MVRYHEHSCHRDWTIQDGLLLVKNIGIDAIHVKSDTQEAINLIIEYDNVDRPLMPLIIDCGKTTCGL